MLYLFYPDTGLMKKKRNTSNPNMFTEYYRRLSVMRWTDALRGEYYLLYMYVYGYDVLCTHTQRKKAVKD